MAQASLYKFSATSMIKCMVKLLEIIISKNFRVHIVCKDRDEMKSMDGLLWTCSQLSFLPHATEDDEYPLSHPILLTVSGKNRNNASVLFANHFVPQDVHDYDRFVSVYDGVHESDSISNQIIELQQLSIPYKIFEERSGSWVVV